MNIEHRIKKEIETIREKTTDKEVLAALERIEKIVC